NKSEYESATIVQRLPIKTSEGPQRRGVPQRTPTATTNENSKPYKPSEAIPRQKRYSPKPS
ncbi:hypothetical protein A2U01_0053828, partial [Trifolium medium]|nr:hypothetical protein [Trifolium medium]